MALTLGRAYLDRESGLRADYIFGLRAWGLILYASMPASLAALGVGKLHVIETKAHEPAVRVAAVVVASIPMVVMFLLIHQRLESWYLARDRSLTRSMNVTVVVFLAAGMLTGAAQVFTDGPPDRAEIFRAIANAFLVGALTLSLSSALFLTAIKSDSGLPLMPTRAFTSDLEKARDVFFEISRSGFWNKNPGALERLGKDIASAKDVLDSLIQHDDDSPRAKLYAKLSADLDALDYARRQAEVASTRFSDFLDPDPVLSEDDQARRAAVDRLRLAMGVRT